MICNMSIFNSVSKSDKKDDAYTLQILLGEKNNKQWFVMRFDQGKSNTQVANDLREMAMSIEYKLGYDVH